MASYAATRNPPPRSTSCEATARALVYETVPMLRLQIKTRF